MVDAAKLQEDLHNAFLQGKSQSIEWRKNQLQALFDMLTEEEARITDALWKDLRKCKHEAVTSEVLMVKSDIAKIIKNIDLWVQPEKVPKNMVTMMDGLEIQKQPYGVVLVLGAWNYPVQLTIMPLAGAIAAGNCAVVKTSEISTNTDKLLMELFSKYLDQHCIRAISGGPDVAGKLLEQKWDYIFYTGNSKVAKIVMEAASKHLTPVTLELGGKSPCYISPGTDLNMVSKRLVWGKFMNVGQTCIAPDYIMCPPDLVDPLSEHVVAAIKEFYTDNPKESPDYGRIVSARHFDRLLKMIESSKAEKVCFEEADKEQLYISPTILKNVKADDAVMEEEIFGPIMPIMAVKNEDEAIHFVNRHDKPLALYVFTKDNTMMQKFKEQTSSGGMLINDVLLHIGVDGFPFGGVGTSGMGSYHGKFSFETFSHKRPILNKSTSEAANNKFRYPPYNDNKLGWIRWALGSSTKKSYCNIL